MKYTIPKEIPLRSIFLNEILESVFPELKEDGGTTGYGYTMACEKAARELGIPFTDSLDEGIGVEVDSNMFRFMYELNLLSKKFFNKESSLITNREYQSYSGTLFTFCSTTSGSFRSWLKQTSDTNRINKSFDTALFFTYLLLEREECCQTREVFLLKCLEYLGITNIEDNILIKLKEFAWEEKGEKARLGEKTFDRLGNRQIILMGAVMLAVVELIGTYSEAKDANKIEGIQEMFSEMFQEEITVAESFDYAEKALMNSNKFFEPRSIPLAKKLYPQDFFVIPEFENNNLESGSPIMSVRTAKKSKRVMIVAKTGLGKSAYLQISTLCMLKDKYSLVTNNMEVLSELSNQLNTPSDMYVISVPAKMFSFCYKDERYHSWTTDFVTLFFNCMWRLSSGFNFFSTQNSPRFTQITQEEQNQYVVTEALKSYVSYLAKTGKLVLMLDSFDEISSGEMRTAYLKTMAAFYDQYCCYPECNHVGAHVIVSSREMSKGTMKLLEYAMDLSAEQEMFGIAPLNHMQRKQLVSKWNGFLGVPEQESREILEEIERNHYYLDYSVNPYMLSVVCSNFGYDLGSVTQRYIDFLVDRMLKNNRMNRTDPVIQDVLMNIVKILQEIAGETITTGNAHFSRRKLNRYLNKLIDKTDLTDEDIERYLEQLNEIFVTEVGLIVPADGRDSDYQFINNQIRFELAAKGIERVLDKEEKPLVYRDVILPSIKNIEEYVGLLIPLLCNINLENVQLSELLISDLVVYDYNDRGEEVILIRAMIDLLLNRYGSNIAVSAKPGSKDARHVRRAQRLLLMRVFTSVSFRPTDIEKKEIKESPAYLCNGEWISDKLKKTLE